MLKLVIQMGHTGRPPHAGSVGTAGEQEFARVVGAECVRLLNRNGWTVALVLADPSLAAYKADAFVAIHCDGSTSAASRGASLGYQTAPGRALAHAVRDAYVRLGWTGGWKPDNYTRNLAEYYGVANAVAQGTSRAMIFETGTMTNAADRALLHSDDGPDRVALAIGAALGIINMEDTDMQLTDPMTAWKDEATGDVPATVKDVLYGGHFHAKHADQRAERIEDQLTRLTALLSDDEGKVLGAVGQLSTKIDALANDEANVIAVIRQLQLGQVDVPALAAALVPLLPPETTAEEVAEAVSDEFARRQQG